DYYCSLSVGSGISVF
nr:immunoglobulin light chain junction region [Macaca mulatta]